MPVEKVCVTCGKTFSVPPSRVATAVTCSLECAAPVRGRSRSRRVELSCRHCGEAFTAPLSHAARRVYCSEVCREASPSHRAAKADAVRGKLNGMWAGGIAHHTDGYLYERRPGHPFSSNGYVLQHRLIVEDAMRDEAPSHRFIARVSGVAYLSPQIDVHHRNGDRKDNRLDNLVAMEPAAHRALHGGQLPEPGSFWPPCDPKELSMKDH
jgi:hypothetical protein